MTQATNKLVYLFELDSVRTQTAQINAGLQALYDEIVVNGNTVVLTFNQIADSALFYELMNKARHEKEAETFENLVKLFQNGALKISQFGTTRTIVEFLINRLERDSFVYSAWPIKSSQPKLCALIKRSLETCDLTELAYFKREDVAAQELRCLFYDTDPGSGAVASTSFTTTLEDPISTLHEKINMIYWLVRFVLRISIIPDIYIPPKAKISDAYKLHSLLKFVAENKVHPVLDVLTGLQSYIEKSNSRSDYEKDIAALANMGHSAQTICHLRLIVDLCYNFASEHSIFGISLHYESSMLGAAFLQDFNARLSRELKALEQGGSEVLSASRNEKSYSAARADKIKFPNLSNAVAASSLSQKKYKSNYKNKSHITVMQYEQGFAGAKKQHRKNLFAGFFSRILLLLLCLFIATCLDFSTSAFEDVVSSNIPFSGVLTVMLETLLFLLVSEYVSVWLSKKIPQFVSLSVAISEVVVAGKNALKTFGRARAHINANGLSAAEDARARAAKTEDCRCDALKIDAAGEETASTIAGTTTHTRTDTAKLWFPTISKSLAACRKAWQGKFSESELAHYEEVNNKKLGLVYSSEYHNFYVDPVGTTNISGFYERLVNRNEGSVVVVPIYKGKFVFLKQFRHSISKEAYSLPRGFGEPGVSAKENAVKELREELCTHVLNNPIHLGKTYPDTGISGSCAEVFLVEIGEYNIKPGYEGIKDIALVAPVDMAALLAQDSCSAPFELNDGFSLAAFALLHAKLQHENLTLEQLLKTS